MIYFSVIEKKFCVIDHVCLTKQLILSHIVVTNRDLWNLIEMRLYSPAEALVVVGD